MEDQVKNWNDRGIEFFTEQEIKFNNKQLEDQQNDNKKESQTVAA